MKRTTKKSDDSLELWSRWFLGEIAFVLLPLAIIATVRSFLGVPLQDILALPDLSFAAIVLFAIGLNKFLFWKNKVQKDGSNRTLRGSRLIVLLLIISSVTLAFSVAAQHGVKVDEQALALSQILLIVLATGFLFLGIKYEVDHEAESRDLPGALSATRSSNLILRDLREAEMKLRRIEWALTRSDSPLDLSVTGSAFSAVPLTLQEVSSLCRRLSNCADHIDQSIATSSQLKLDVRGPSLTKPVPITRAE